MKTAALLLAVVLAVAVSWMTPPVFAGDPWTDASAPVSAESLTVSSALECPPDSWPACVTVYYESIYAGDIYSYKETVCSEKDAVAYIKLVDAQGFDPDNTINDHIAHGAIRRMDWILLPPGGSCEGPAKATE
jgi:hypothetical protein